MEGSGKGLGFRVQGLVFKGLEVWVLVRIVNELTTFPIVSVAVRCLVSQIPR